MKMISKIVGIALVLTMAACGKDGTPGANGTNGACCTLGPAGISVTGVIELPGVNCPQGGIKYTSASGDEFVCNGTTGATGLTGGVGPAGSQGLTGTVGGAGPQGPAGTVGPNGAQGSTGATGAAGLAGLSVYSLTEPAGGNCAAGGTKYTSALGVDYVCNGEPGTTGAVGPAGSQGLLGPIGPQGIAGLDGAAGSVGPAGAQGLLGPVGPQGLIGITGATGATGAAGLAGMSVYSEVELPGAKCAAGGTKYTSALAVDYVCNGEFGLTGSVGPAGAQGLLGPIGPQGIAGLDGAAGSVGSAGAQGLLGPVGPQGSAGLQGTTGSIGPSGSQGLTGLTGSTGATGAPGAAGSAGTSVSGASEPAGSNCLTGGIRWSSAGVDSFVCNGSVGAAGALGAPGSIGPIGPTGPAGAAGVSVVGASEPAGGLNCPTGGISWTTATGTEYVCNGPIGPSGVAGSIGQTGLIGLTGATGADGPTGPTGPAGPAGGALAYGYFYALMPGDNAATVAPDTAVAFPQTGASSGGILRFSASQFILPAIGVYEISWQVSTDEAGQLMLGLDNGGGAGVAALADTVAGRATGNSQIVNHVLLSTSVINSVLTVRNPAGNPVALTITPSAGGTHSVSASLVIKQIL